MGATQTIRFAVVCLFAALAGLGIACNKDNPVQPTPPGHSAITLQATLTSIRWCRLQWNNDSTAASHRYVLIRDDRDTVFNDTVAIRAAQKTLQDSGLAPGSEYTYRVYRIVNGKHWDSATVTVRTLDTTRDNYVWETTRLGNAGSVLYGIWGATPNSLWLAGLVGNADSGKNYLALHIANGQPEYLQTSLGGAFHGVYGLTDSMVWFAGDNVLSEWDGLQFTSHVFDGDSLPYWNTSFTSIWVAPDGLELFAAGTNGTIVHRKPDGKTWERMESGVTGFSFSRLIAFSANDVFVVGETTDPGDGILLHYDGSIWSTVVKGKSPPPDSTFLTGRFTDVSGSGADSLVLVGAEVYHRNGPRWDSRTPTTLGALTLIEGADAKQWNCQFMVGDFGQVIKFDGEKWVLFRQLLNAGPNEILRAVRVVGDEVFIVGDDDQGAIFLHGH